MIQVLKLNASCLKIVTHYQLPRIRWSIWNEQIWIAFLVTGQKSWGHALLLVRAKMLKSCHLLAKPIISNSKAREEVNDWFNSPCWIQRIN